MALTQSPYVMYADEEGNVFEDESLYAVGRSGYFAQPIDVEDWIELPEGGNLYNLPDRRPVGIDVETGEMRECDLGLAVAAFVPPAYSCLYWAAWTNHSQAEILPLFNYTAVGFFEGKFYVPAMRIEADIRQEAEGYDEALVAKGMLDLRARYPHNRVVEHLANNCTLKYHCPASRNFFLGRWECPIPSSPACNSNCLGCISIQPEDEPIISPQDRLAFKPSAGEIVEFTVDHLETAEFPIVSFGQGCEGEPLLMWETIRESIIQMRKFTAKGSININTNGSMPDAVEELCKVGLDSIRVSTNSVQKRLYDPYYLPNNYAFEDIIQSLRVVNQYGGWTSLNYFVFPGVTDTEAEFEAMCQVIRDTGLNMIQWRNFSIDPDWYLETLKIQEGEFGQVLGIKQMMQMLRNEFPDLRYGYYNPPIERIKGDFEKDFAH